MIATQVEAAVLDPPSGQPVARLQALKGDLTTMEPESLDRQDFLTGASWSWQ